MPSIEMAIEAYRRHGSVWKAGAELGVSGQRVHLLLRKGDFKIETNFFSDDEVRKILDFYHNTPSETFSLDDFAKSLGRPKTNICRYARALGLTRKSRPVSTVARKNMKLAKHGMWSRSEHPRGMLGKTHTQEVKADISQKSRRNWSTWKTFQLGPMTEENRSKARTRMSVQMSTRDPSTMHTRAKGGRRSDLGDTFFRSSWEANYARYLNLLQKLGAIESWAYEPETFWFNGVRRGANSYKPDFRIKHKDDPHLEYIELKGWIVPKDRTKWRRMAKYHPHIKLTIVAAKQYYAVERKWASAISEWEKPARLIARKGAA